MERVGVCLLFVCVLSVGGCASNGPRHPELPLPAQPLALEGFSFLPPNEAGWQMIHRTPYWAALAKRGTAADEGYVIQAMLLQLPPLAGDQAFLAYSKKAIGKDSDPSRFRILRNSDRLVAGRRGKCVRTTMKAWDTDPLTASGRHDPMLLEIVSFTCRHPDNPEIGVQLSYSKRYISGGAGEDLIPQADGLFDSVRFSKITIVESEALKGAASGEE